MSSEAFLYIWYDAPNKKYYLGKHKGSPDDSYTHSSTVWESFTKSTIPDGVRRRILAYGTDEEMTKLEYDLLLNRKQKCWDHYYNVSSGWPLLFDTSGTNHPMYGRKHSEEARKKMSKAHKGKKHSEETRKKITEANKRRKHSEESKKKIGKAHKGKKISEEHRKKTSEYNKAYWQAQTEEYKNKRGQILANARWKKHREMKEQANV